MSDPKKTEIVQQPKQVENVLEMVLAQMEHGGGIASKLNDSHIDQIIKQRGTIIDRVHDDRKNERWDSKFYVITSFASALIVIFGVMFFKPDYLSETITALLAGAGGFGGGYGLAKK